MKFFLTAFFILTTLSLKALPMLEGDEVKHHLHEAANLDLLRQQTAPREDDVSSSQRRGETEETSLASLATKGAPSREVREEEAVEEIKNEKQIAQKLVQRLSRWRSEPTMMFLKMLDVINSDSTPGATTFYALNRRQNESDIDIHTRCLLLNGDDNLNPPLKLFIPEENGQTSLTITPSLILQGQKSTINNESYEASNRNPTTEENRKVRKIVHQVFQAFYGDIDNKALQERIRSIILPDNLELPLTAQNVQDLFLKVPENTNGDNHAAYDVVSSKMMSQEGWKNLVRVYENQLKDQLSINANIFYNVNEAYQTLREPERHLDAALYHGASMLARTVGVVGVTAVGSSAGANFVCLNNVVVGGISGGIGSVIGSVIGSSIGGPIGGLFGGAVGMLSANYVSKHVAQDFEQHIGRHIASYASQFIRPFIINTDFVHLREQVRSLACLNGVVGAAMSGPIENMYGVVNGITNGTILSASFGYYSGCLFGGWIGGLYTGRAAMEYFRPGTSLEKAKEELTLFSTFKENENKEKLSILMTSLNRDKKKYEAIKPALQRVFKTITSSHPAFFVSSSSVDCLNAEELKNIRILKAVEEILLGKVNGYITESKNLIARLQTDINRRALNKKENAAMRGYSEGRDEIYYRRPGI